MKHFEVYSHPALGLQAVKKGFSWPGFFFTWIWMLICRMWVGAIGVFLIVWVGWFATDSVAVMLAGDGGEVVDEEQALFIYGMSFLLWCGLYLVIALVVGIAGNRWREKVLVKRGFEYRETVQAQSAEAAQGKVLAEEKAAAKPASP